MNIIIRSATLDDAKAITEINISDVNTWVRFDDNKLEQDKYENISVEDRYLKGGPWMSIETCAIHLNYMLTTPGNFVYVAELDSKVAGEIEVVLDREHPPYGKHAFIYLLWIHKQARGKGIGSKLVRYVEEKAIKEYKVNKITVVPEKESIKFYQKLGFSEFEKYTTIEVYKTTREISVSKIDLDTINDLHDWFFIIGRFASSRSILFNMKCKYYFPKLKIEKYAFSFDLTDGEAIAIIRKSRRCIIPCSFYCWIKTHSLSSEITKECIEIASGLANKLNVDKLITCVRNDFKKEVSQLKFVKIRDEFPFFAKILENTSSQ
mgnify:CR=1 FL=1